MKTVIYHSADFDGIFCREIAKRFLGTEGVNYIGWNFGKPTIPMPLSGPVYVLDLSPDCLCPPPAVPGLELGRIVWIDHHKSSIEKWGSTGLHDQIPGYRIDGVAACRLAWQWFVRQSDGGKDSFGTSYDLPKKEHFVNRVVGEPLAVRLAGEYDIWDHRGDGDLEFQFGLRVQGEKLNIQDLLGSDANVGEILRNGVVAMAYSKDSDASTMHRSYLTEWEGMKLLTLNTARCNSLTFDARDVPETGHDALLAYYFNGKCWSVSLYHAKHRKELDLSLIAVKYGGGGHRGACGFTCQKLPFL